MLNFPSSLKGIFQIDCPDNKCLSLTTNFKLRERAKLFYLCSSNPSFSADLISTIMFVHRLK